jgi:hypothetical protein
VRGLAIVAGVGSGGSGGGGAGTGTQGCDATLPRFGAGGEATSCVSASAEAEDFRFGMGADY